MDNNEYRTMLIVKAYEFSECVPTVAKQCEDWTLITTNGDFEIRHKNKIVLSISNKNTNLSSNINSFNRLPFFVEQWFVNCCD